jgi:hypothetical protein
MLVIVVNEEWQEEGVVGPLVTVVMSEEMVGVLGVEACQCCHR